jgi:hypothetical protein
VTPRAFEPAHGSADPVRCGIGRTPDRAADVPGRDDLVAHAIDARGACGDHAPVIATRDAVLGALVLLLSLAAGPGLAAASPKADGRFGPYDVRTMFVIGKNTDRNEVQFGIRLDADCVPVGDEPIYPYWRQYEKGPDVTEDLNFLDRTGYGIKSQAVEQRSAAGSKVVLRLRAQSNRSIAVYTRKEGAACVAEPLAYISGVPARLDRIHVQLSGPLSVSWIELRGVRTDDKQPIVERTKP